MTTETRLKSRATGTDGVSGGAARIALIYAIIGVTYILVSDRLVGVLFSDVETITLVSTLKGWGFIVITALLLWVMIRRHSAGLLASEERRLEREAQLSSLMDSVGGYIYIKGLDYRYQFANAAVCDLFGVSPEEIVGAEDAQFVDAATAAALRSNDRRVIENGERLEAEEEHVSSRSGETRTYLSVKMPLRRADGSIYGLCGISTDITERTAVEQERVRLQTQLVQAQKMEAIGQLTGGIAHDFNNILASILGYTALAMQCGDAKRDPELADCLAEVQRAGERARDLVTKLLQFSRGRAGDGSVLSLRAQPVVAEVVKMLGATIASSIHISAELDEAAPEIQVDAVELHQVLTNLAINARDAIDGTGTIGIALRPRRFFDEAICAACHAPFSGDFVELAVSDSGSGIATDHLNAIFDPFFTTKDVGKGTGLGLSVVHGIMHKIGGHIMIESRPGIGTVIRLLFRPADATVAESRGVAGAEALPERVSTARVMVVDDEQALTRLMKAMLERRGFRVTTFTDSRLALEAFLAAPTDFDIVVTDQTMPGITGDELAREMTGRRADLPILLCSGFSERIDAATAAELGVRRVLAKPVAMATLLQAITEATQP